jgi:protein-L-isoaspartate(D-aspartate) O-methyltransferase
VICRSGLNGGIVAVVSEHPASLARGRGSDGRRRDAGIFLFSAALVFIAAVPGWAGAKEPQDGPPARKPYASSVAPEPEDAAAREHFARLRRQMVEDQLRARDITDRKVLDAMARVPRHRFVPLEIRELAYRDRALPIGHAQTISQPYIVALTTHLVRPAPAKRALDIGTGSGYQAAILAELCKSVCTIEIVAPLADSARTRLAALGYKNIEVRAGDGYRGWPERAPFDIITVAAAAGEIPEPLVAQLAPGGRLVMPVGESLQELILVEKRGDGSLEKRSIVPVAFVPLTGEAQSTTKDR